MFSCLFFILGFISNFPLAVFLLTAAMFAKGFHHSGTSVNPMDIAPKHPGFVYGVVNSAGSMSGSREAMCKDETFYFFSQFQNLILKNPEFICQ